MTTSDRILILSLIVLGLLYVMAVIKTEPEFVPGAFTSTQNGDLR